MVVEEWISNRNEYQTFLGPLDFESEVRRFRTIGEFAGPLGDALPLGLANVLSAPLMILTTVHNMPIISVVPRRTVSNGQTINLAYTQHGPGHYDALFRTAENENAGNKENLNNLETSTSNGKNLNVPFDFICQIKLI